jgi:hypothetical protein
MQNSDNVEFALAAVPIARNNFVSIALIKICHQVFGPSGPCHAHDRTLTRS